MADLYHNFADLAANERPKIDYRIRYVDRSTPFVILAPHGGRMEPDTSEIAEAIAGADLSFYTFEALRPAGDRGSLHITSTKFDEPQALALLDEVQKVVAIHGRADDGDPLTVAVGGRDVALRNGVVAALRAEGFAAAIVTQGHLAGKELANICNRSRSGAGVQLELPRPQRHQLVSNADFLQAFCQAIRNVILSSLSA